jgi:hypothetical protein
MMHRTLLIAAALAAGPVALAATVEKPLTDSPEYRSLIAHSTRTALGVTAERAMARDSYAKFITGNTTGAQYLRHSFAKDLLGAQLDLLDDAKAIALLRTEPRNADAIDLLQRVERVQRYAAAKPEDYKALYLATRPYCAGEGALLVSGEGMATMDPTLLPTAVDGALVSPVSLGYAVSSCLFTRAAHLTDPKAWELIARWDGEALFDRGIGRGLARVRAGDRDPAPELRNQRLLAKAWLASRMLRAYQDPEFKRAQEMARRQQLNNDPKKLSKDAQFVLDSAADFGKSNNTPLAIETLRAGARHFKTPYAKAEHALALARYLMTDLQNDAAAAAFTEALLARELKAADQGSAMLQFGVVCIRRQDEAAFDAVLAQLIAAYKAKGWETLTGTGTKPEA